MKILELNMKESAKAEDLNKVSEICHSFYKSLVNILANEGFTVDETGLIAKVEEKTDEKDMGIEELLEQAGLPDELKEQFRTIFANFSGKKEKKHEFVARGLAEGLNISDLFDKKVAQKPKESIITIAFDRVKGTCCLINNELVAVIPREVPIFAVPLAIQEVARRYKCDKVVFADDKRED